LCAEFSPRLARQGPTLYRRETSIEQSKGIWGKCVYQVLMYFEGQHGAQPQR
jgi:hypothetical protein